MNKSLIVIGLNLQVLDHTAYKYLPRNRPNRLKRVAQAGTAAHRLPIHEE